LVINPLLQRKRDRRDHQESQERKEPIKDNPKLKKDHLEVEVAEVVEVADLPT
jgi:hypothetical protein